MPEPEIRAEEIEPLPVMPRGGPPRGEPAPAARTAFDGALPRAAAPAVAEVTGRARVGATLLVAGAFCAVLVWVPSQMFDLERYLVPKALALHLTALALLGLGLVPLRRSAWGRTGLLLAGVVGWGALTAAFATNRWLAFAAWGISFSSAALFLSARALPERLRRPALAGILTAVVIGSALGIAQSYGLDAAWLSDSRPPGGTFGNRNFLGHLAAIAAPALLMTALAARRRRWAVAALFGLAVLAAAIVLTRSRAAWLGGLVGALCALVAAVIAAHRAGGGFAWGRLALGGALTGGAIAAAVLLPNDLNWTTDTPYAATLGDLAEYREGSGAGRLVQYQNSLGLVRSHPLLGVGPGNWFVHYPLVTTPNDPAYAGSDLIPTNPWPSSDWVAHTTERGPIGALLLLAAIAAAALAAQRRRDGGPAADPLAAGAVAGVLAAAAVCGAFDAVLLLAAPSFVTWATVGLLLPREPASPDAPAAKSAWRGAATLVAAVLTLYTGAHAAAILMTREATGTAAVERAALLTPGEHRLHLALAERGRCAHARRAARLMPHHERAVRMAEGCG